MPRPHLIAVRLTVAVSLFLLGAASAPAASLKLMTFNVWVAEGTAAGRAKLAQIIQAAGADVVGLQEMDNSAGVSIANQLGMYYHQQSGGDIQILSRYPIVDTSPSGYGVEIQYGPAASMWLFNAHLAAYPYQPYDLRDGFLPKNEAAVIAAANSARGSQVTAYLNDMTAVAELQKPLFVTGDFNEPSHLDWTAAAASATPRPFDLKVEYPASKRIVDAGMIDSLRAVRPNEVADPAYTWTPGAPPPNIDANEVQDRIDFVYHRGIGVTPSEALIVGPTGGDAYTNIAVPGYNADHRSVVVEFSLPDVTPRFADFNADGVINQLDWGVLRSNQFADLGSLTVFDAYARGDLNTDRQNNFADFALFKRAYEGANGVGSFAQLMASVPEPQTWLLAVLAFAARGLTGSRRQSD